MPGGCEPDSQAAAFILAGGQSSRMGTDKALLEFGGRPLIAHAAGILAAAGLPVFIAGAPAQARQALAAHAPVIADDQPGLGPLAGVCAALAATSAEFLVFLPVDAPLLPSSLITYLLRRARITGAAVTLASVSGSPQTFPAVIARRVRPVLENELRGRHLGCRAAFQTAAGELGEPVSVVTTELLAQSGQVWHHDALPVAHWFLNFNTEQDVCFALSLRRSRVT